MTLDALDCQGLAGGFTLGVVQAGFRLVGKREQRGGFGAPIVEGNRHLLGDYPWETEEGGAEEWTPYSVPLVFGNPPCSGFSLMTNKDFRGVDSVINSCMWDLVGFAARCDPEVVIMESVAQAFTGGRALMLGLRQQLEVLSGKRYDVTHVVQDCLSVGGCAVRRRYFLVMHRVPFGVEHFPLVKLPTLGDAIGDLEHVPLSWNPQRVETEPSWWAASLRGPADLVDGHDVLHCAGGERVTRLAEIETWNERESMDQVLTRYYQRTGEVPGDWAGLNGVRKVVEAGGNEFKFGYNQCIRWRWEHPSRVITGGALGNVLHPRQPRMITHREAMRILGFPDAWQVQGLKSSQSAPYYGKGVSVHVGKWIAEWARRAIEGEPGTVTGELIGERERLVDVSKDWRKFQRGEAVA